MGPERGEGMNERETPQPAVTGIVEADLRSIWLDAKRGTRAFSARLARMSVEERINASRTGGFTRRERSIWAARHPEQVPLIDGEFEWIARSLADLD
jgi:hypothetical protein